MTALFELLEARARETGSLLCVGLDPHPDLLSGSSAQAVLEWCLRMIEATASSACAFKVNSAFFEIYGGEGWQALKQLIQSVPPPIPVILDAKRGDIASTSTAYARAAFDGLRAGALTVNPYLGPDALAPFFQYPEKGVFVLCKTSNPGSSELQDLPSPSGEPLYIHVARRASAWAEGKPVGLVVGATDLQALANVRAADPHAWIHAPGVGAQGGDLEGTVRAGVRGDGLGLLVAVSRALARAVDPGLEAAQMVSRIQAAQSVPSPRKAAMGLAADLVSSGCVVFGEFRLRSGEVSPIYLDLRRLASHPRVLARAAAAYLPHLQRLNFEVLAGIPYAGLPIATAISLQTGKPMVYPRREVKVYGRQAAVEGEFHPGDRAVLIDDVATSGGSKIEAAERLRGAGLTVADVVVLVDRQAGAGMSLEAAGLSLHAVFDLDGLLDEWGESGLVPQEQIGRVRTSLAHHRVPP